MDSRQKLQEELENILGSRNVYFQPPASVKMKYPAIVYVLDTADQRYADNKIYHFKFKWTLTYINKELNLEMIEKIAKSFSLCSYNSHYISDGLYHDTYTLYY